MIICYAGASTENAIPLDCGEDHFLSSQSLIAEWQPGFGEAERGNHCLAFFSVCGSIPVVSEIIPLVCSDRILCLDLTRPQCALLFRSKPLNLLWVKWDIEKSPDIPGVSEQSISIVRAKRWEMQVTSNQMSWSRCKGWWDSIKSYWFYWNMSLPVKFPFKRSFLCIPHISDAVLRTLCYWTIYKWVSLTLRKSYSYLILASWIFLHDKYLIFSKK